MSPIRYTLTAGMIALLSLAGCSSSKKATPSLSLSASKHPLFMDNVTLDGKSRTGGMRVAPSKERKAASRIQPSDANVLQMKYASMMKVEPQAIANMSLYNFIDDWYGTPYRFGGVDRTGIDCSAFVQRLYEQVFGTNLVRTAMEQFNKTELIWDFADLHEGDLVFFRIRSSRISHVGIYLLNNYFVHASSSQGVMISSLGDNYWQRYFAGAGRVL